MVLQAANDVALNATCVSIDELWAFTQSISVETSSEDLGVADFASKRCRQVGEALNVALDSIAVLLGNVGDVSVLGIERGIDSLTEGVQEALEVQSRFGAQVKAVASQGESAMSRHTRASDGSVQSTVFDQLDGIAAEFKDRLAKSVVGLTIFPMPSTFSYDAAVPPSVTSALTGPTPSFRRAPFRTGSVGGGWGSSASSRRSLALQPRGDATPLLAGAVSAPVAFLGGGWRTG